MTWFQKNAHNLANIVGVGILVLILIISWVLYRVPQGSKHELPQVFANDFESVVLKADTPVLVDFYADWCGPCKMMEPILEEFAKENPQVKVVQVNVDENRELSHRYKIQGIPALLFFKKGELIDQKSGAMGKDGLKALVNQ
jgi:thioredoxin 1